MPFVKLVDGKLQAVKLEYNLSFHCNLACAGCSHLSPWHRKELASLEVFEADLAALARVYRVRRFRFVGGEPLLHPQVLDFLRAVRRSGLARDLNLCTNGVRLDRASDELIGELDILSVSWYPGTEVDAALVARTRARCEALGTELRLERVSHFREMEAPEPGPEALQRAIFDTCQIAHSWSCQTFYEGRFYLCSRPLVTGSLRRRQGLEVADLRELDGVDLHAPRLRERLAAYLAHTEPLESCRHCLGTVGRQQPWRALSVQERRHPEVDLTPAEARVDRSRLGYLRARRAVEKGVLEVVPSHRLARALSLLGDLPYRTSRTSSWLGRRL